MPPSVYSVTHQLLRVSHHATDKEDKRKNPSHWFVLGLLCLSPNCPQLESHDHVLEYLISDVFFYVYVVVCL